MNLILPTNYHQTVSIRVDAGVGTEVNNLRLAYEENIGLSPIFQGKFSGAEFFTYRDNTRQKGVKEYRGSIPLWHLS